MFCLPSKLLVFRRDFGFLFRRIFCGSSETSKYYNANMACSFGTVIGKVVGQESVYSSKVLEEMLG